MLLIECEIGESDARCNGGSANEDKSHPEELTERNLLLQENEEKVVIKVKLKSDKLSHIIDAFIL